MSGGERVNLECTREPWSLFRERHGLSGSADIIHGAGLPSLGENTHQIEAVPLRD